MSNVVIVGWRLKSKGRESGRAKKTWSEVIRLDCLTLGLTEAGPPFRRKLGVLHLEMCRQTGPWWRRRRRRWWWWLWWWWRWRRRRRQRWWWLSCHIPLNIKQFEPPSVEWYGGKDGPLHFFQTRVILQGWRRNSSVRTVIEIVELTHSYYR